MTRLTISILLLTLTATGCNKASAEDPKIADSAESKYVNFQLMTGLHGYAGPQPMPGHFALSKMQLEEFVHDVVKAIGTTGDARHKLGFTVGPLCFDMSDEETRQFIHDSFAVARENDVAVAFHIDDSISWGERKDLLSNPDNVETADWKQQPNTGRRADWGPILFMRREFPARNYFATSLSRTKDCVQRIQRELPAWVQKSGQQAKVAPLAEKIEALMKDRKWQEADEVADEILSLMSSGDEK